MASSSKIFAVRRLGLRAGDRVEFVVSPRTGFAKRVACYRRFSDR
jgi:hypothetical protein